MDKQFNLTRYCACDYLSTLTVKINHASTCKKSPPLLLSHILPVLSAKYTIVSNKQSVYSKWPVYVNMHQHFKSRPILEERNQRNVCVYGNFMMLHWTRRPWPWFNIKLLSYQYRKSHCRVKTVVIWFIYIESAPMSAETCHWKPKKVALPAHMRFLKLNSHYLDNALWNKFSYFI